MELSIEEQRDILRQLSDEQIALLPQHIQELIYRGRELEALGAVGGVYVEPTQPVVLPTRTKKKKK
jgi:hypothetical protein